jgi:16S rRNA processing protein RimM
LSTSSTDGPPLFLEVGRVARPHGLRGQVIVELLTNRAERVGTGARLRGPTGELEVVRATPHGEAGGRQRWLVAFRGVGSLDEAESLRGAILTAAAIDDPEALWVHELIGAEVVDPSGVAIGQVEAVESNPASDLLVLRSGALIPLHFVIHHEPGRLTVDLPPGLLDL